MNAVKILDSNKPKTIEKRFQIMASLLSGKHDISTGRPSEDIVADVDLSPSTIRSFLNMMHELNLVKKEFIPAGSLPVCSGIGWPNHNEYDLTAAGVQFVAEQLVLWESTPFYSQAVGQSIRNHLQRLGSKE